MGCSNISPWLTPSGFLASQAYYEVDEHIVHTKLFGHKRIKVLSELDAPHPGRHGQGMAPNFVHSMDASHLQLTVNRAAEAKISNFAMIHDSYGTSLAKAGLLFRLIRECFIEMYLFYIFRECLKNMI